MRLALGRARDQGADFDSAWRRSLPGVTVGLSPDEATGWRLALAATKDGWQRAYRRDGQVWKLAALD